MLLEFLEWQRRTREKECLVISTSKASLSQSSWPCSMWEQRSVPAYHMNWEGSPWILYSMEEVDNEWRHWNRIFPVSASFCIGPMVCMCPEYYRQRYENRQAVIEVVHSPQTNATPISPSPMPQCPVENPLIWRPNSSSHFPSCLSLLTLAPPLSVGTAQCIIWIKPCLVNSLVWGKGKLIVFRQSRAAWWGMRGNLSGFLFLQ